MSTWDSFQEKHLLDSEIWRGIVTFLSIVEDVIPPVNINWAKFPPHRPTLAGCVILMAMMLILAFKISIRDLLHLIRLFMR